MGIFQIKPSGVENVKERFYLLSFSIIDQSRVRLFIGDHLNRGKMILQSTLKPNQKLSKRVYHLRYG